MSTCKSCFFFNSPHILLCVYMCVCLHMCIYTYGGDGWIKGEMKGRGRLERGRGEMKSRKLQPGVNVKVFISLQLALVQGEPWNLVGEEEFLLTKSHHLLWLLHSFPLTSVLFHLEIRRRASAIDTTLGATNLIECSFLNFFSPHLKFLNAKTWSSNIKKKIIWNNSAFPKSLQVQTITPK